MIKNSYLKVQQTIPNGLHEINSKALVIILSDSDSAFKGDNRNEDKYSQKLLSDNYAALDSD